MRLHVRHALVVERQKNAGAIVIGFSAGVQSLGVGAVISIVFNFVLAVLILKKKNLLGYIKYWLLVVATLLGTFVLGSLLGLIPVAFLTTREKKA